MTRNRQRAPFINVRTKENRTPTGRRTSTPAKRAALYYAYGRKQEMQRDGRQRGEWMGPDGRTHAHEDVVDWVKAGALTHRYTFQGLLSVPEGELTAAAFCQAMQKGGQIDDWRLIGHDDTEHRHAHVLWFGDKRMEKEAFLSWQTAVRAELATLEQQQLDGRAAQQEQGLGAARAEDAGREAGLRMTEGAAQGRSRSQEVGIGW